MCTYADDAHFVSLGHPRRIWTVPAIHGDLASLIRLHDALLDTFTPGDRIVYHGNYTGYGTDSAACVDEILAFRRLILCRSGVKPTDLIYLRGRQEEIWLKLLQIQFAPQPLSVLQWMLSNGIEATLKSYGVSIDDGLDACRYGIMDLTRWTMRIRDNVRQHPGHEIFASQLKRAAHTDTSALYPMLFVHAGLNAHYRLEDQGEYLWWGTQEFEAIQQAYMPFQKVVRGFDPEHRGVHLNCITATVDNGAGFGGNLVSVGFEQNGQILDIIEA
jgi:serine/threonine protein phosphatase 1